MGPARAGKGKHPRESTRSSYLACMGRAKPLNCLAVGDLFALFGNDLERGRAAFERYVSARRFIVNTQRKTKIGEFFATSFSHCRVRPNASP